MEKLFYKHYAAIVQRGLISRPTDGKDFYEKLKEEVSEIGDANSSEINSEIMDVMCVCANWLTHSGINLKKELKKNLKKQQSRI